MNAKERYDMVEQYLDDAMSPEARREFEQLAHQDSELARELRAEQMIRSAFQNDSAALPLISGTPSAAIMGTLAATGVETATVVSTGVVATILGTPLGLTIVGAAIALGLAAGILFFGPFSEKQTNLTPPQAVPTMTTSPTPSGQAGENVSSSADAQIDEGATSLQNREEERGLKDGGKEQRVQGSIQYPTVEAEKRRASKEDALGRYLEEQENRKDIPTLRDDSIRLKLEVEKGK